MKRKKQGFILGFASVLMLLLVLPTLILLVHLGAESNATEKNTKGMMALSLAEGGIERAIWELNYGNITNWDGASPCWALNTSTTVGTIEVNLTKLENNNFIAESTGRVPFGNLMVTRTIRTLLDEVPASLFGYGLFSDGNIMLSSNARVDSYDSSLGDYGEANVGCEGDIGTNSSDFNCISVAGNAIVNGSATTGVDSDINITIDTAEAGAITGSRESLRQPKELLMAIPPENLMLSGDLLVGEDETTFITESAEYDSLEIASGGKTIIAGDVTLYITGDLIIGSSAQFDITENSSLQIYFAGNFIQSSNSAINNLTKDPTKLIMVGVGDPGAATMDWNSNTDFYGAVYAPFLDIQINSNAGFYGALIARNIVCDSNAEIHYDIVLRDLVIDGADEGKGWIIVESWQERIW